MIKKEQLFPDIEDEEILFKPSNIKDVDEEFWRYEKKRDKRAEFILSLFYTLMIVMVSHTFYVKGLIIGVFILIGLLIFYFVFTGISNFLREKYSLPGFIISKRGMIPLNIEVALMEYLFLPNLFNRRKPIPFEKIHTVEISKRVYDNDLQYYKIWVYMEGIVWDGIFDIITNIQEFLQVLIPRVPQDVKWRIFEGKRSKENEKENVIETLRELVGEEKWKEIYKGEPPDEI